MSATSIHQQAVSVLGNDERLSKLRRELTEAVNAIDRYEEGKGSADDIINEMFDVLYVAKSLQHMTGFERYNEREQVGHSIQADEKLTAAIRVKMERCECAYVGDGDA